MTVRWSNSVLKQKEAVKRIQAKYRPKPRKIPLRSTGLKSKPLKPKKCALKGCEVKFTPPNGSINILGRKKYEGTGDYDYVDEEAVKHHLHFDRIGVDTAHQTVADGEIADTAGFQLSHQFDYKGSVHLIASNQFLTFSGFVRPTFRCDSIGKNWIRFSNEINPARVEIPVDAATTDKGEKLFAGIIQSSQDIYAVFLAPKRAAADIAILDAKGVLTYDKLSGKFIITTKEKADKPGISGNYLSLDDAKCTLYAQGKLQFDANFGQVKMETAGTINCNLNNDSIQINVMIPVDFYFNDEALKIMSDNVMMNTALNTGAKNSMETYQRNLTELVGKEKADKMMADLNLYGSFKKVPEDLQHTLLLSDIKLVYNKIDRTFQSSGPIGINIINKEYINKYVKGTLEIAYKRTGNALTLYFDLDNKSWFYYNYSRGLMQAISSVSGFNEVIDKMKPEKRSHKEKDMPDYEFSLSTDRAAKNFQRKIATQNAPKEEDKQEENK